MLNTMVELYGLLITVTALGALASWSMLAVVIVWRLNRRNDNA